MNRIVREHYPVEKLPEDLREGLPPGRKVTITIEDTEPTTDADARIQEILRNPKPMTFSQARALVGHRPTTEADAVTRIRALRDEWDE